MNIYNIPKFKIPKVEYQEVFQSLSEVYDWSLVDLNIPEAHKSTMGENVHICVIDSGKSEHFEVQNNIVDSKNFTNSSTVNDLVSHSTFCSGLIAANTNNEGIIGVAPKAKLYFAKSIDDSGAGNPSAMTNAVYWAIEKQVDIISISAGSFFDFKPLHEAVKVAYAKNITMCCAVGNSGNRFANVAFPARYPECMGIAAYDHNKKVATFSSRGINVFCALPGVDIYSTSLNNGYSKAQGTCLTKDSIIYTPNGPITIFDLNIGDTVYSLDDDKISLKINKVINKWSHGIKPCKQIKTKSTEIKCTGNHPILTNNNGSFSWKQADDIKKGDLIVCANGLPELHKEFKIEINENWNVSLLNKVIPKRGDFKLIGTKAAQGTISGFLSKRYGMKYKLALPIINYYKIPPENLVFGLGSAHPKIKLPSISKDLAYLFGFYLGDGWITKPRTKKGKSLGSRLYFAKTNIDAVNIRLISCFKNVFLHEIPETEKSQYEICNTTIADIFEQKCGHKKAKDKDIPLWIFSQSKDIIKAFISGLIDSDGYMTEFGYAITSCSKKLVTNLACLLDYTGNKRFQVRYRSRKLQPPHSKKVITSHEYTLYFRIENNEYIKNNESCRNNFESYCQVGTYTDIRCEKVMSITEVGEHEIFDIEVENNHNFIANNIVVHNSFSTPLMAGICALILSKHRKEKGIDAVITPSQMMEHLRKYSKKLNGNPNEVGFGTVDVVAAVN